MAVTIKDVAKQAGVSYSTVSRALNDPKADKSDKKKRILRIAQEMGYVPNQAAINLKMSRSYVIGLYFSTISKMTSPFVLHDVLTGVYSVVGSKYNIVVKGIDMHEPGTLNPTYFDGIIVLSQRNEDLDFMEEVISKGIPMVVICRAVFLDVPNVTTDEAKAMEKAMDYLIENGHRRIGVIEGNSRLDSTRLRHRGWRTSMKKHGLDPDSLPVEHGTYRYASGYQAAKRLLEQDLTAILSFNDEMAFGAREAVTELGLKVPDDVSLVGFDNWDLSGYASMKLTTVERNMGEIAREGTRVLLRRLEDGIIDNRRIYLDNKLIIRETVKNLNE
ncbi:LacI family DNA-binding transcriptional regulator [Clostridium sp. MCC353]|uniref:LacI family DNA-binding transcriptional regulator n=1 Tax=Clostridium sp. MCC353 TaxID=2592646 RepID=UPI001C037361|nr:LacI family DNA-binding transcriptional regulator [Clostridium sp. MCC353]MBT9776829.1 LacI family DNA-binding transcriptional regulator [Clostridium sp. MCC353]